ncbi:Zinc knuckle CX2CX4HX4C [Melia azedarach]|uniref:Zinc knuckle CX2CX4HX4C n=1 Tax=Melia azedarach TaxID=155640 RepID=A0ACC1XYF7_MELAZ|nr:Zinc knuckle CX2CX4HX4C [Melia azedarach]
MLFFSVAAAIGKPLRVDHATASLNRPSVARVLVEYDISRPLLPRLWIGEGDDGFWQDIIFERVPPYCGACRHLGHSRDECYLTRPELRAAKPKQTETAQTQEKKRKTPTQERVSQQMGCNRPRYIIRADRREQTDTHTTTGDTTRATVETQVTPVQQATQDTKQDVVGGQDDSITEPIVITTETAQDAVIPETEDTVHEQQAVPEQTQETPQEAAATESALIVSEDTTDETPLAVVFPESVETEVEPTAEPPHETITAETPIIVPETTQETPIVVPERVETEVEVRAEPPQQESTETSVALSETTREIPQTGPVTERTQDPTPIRRRRPAQAVIDSIWRRNLRESFVPGYYTDDSITEETGVEHDRDCPLNTEDTHIPDQSTSRVGTSLRVQDYEHSDDDMIHDHYGYPDDFSVATSSQPTRRSSFTLS